MNTNLLPPNISKKLNALEKCVCQKEEEFTEAVKNFKTLRDAKNTPSKYLNTLAKELEVDINFLSESDARVVIQKVLESF